MRITPDAGALDRDRFIKNIASYLTPGRYYRFSQPASTGEKFVNGAWFVRLSGNRLLFSEARVQRLQPKIPGHGTDHGPTERTQTFEVDLTCGRTATAERED